MTRQQSPIPLPRHGSPLLTQRLLDSFERHLLAEGKRASTIDHYLGATRQFAAFCPEVLAATRAEVEEWLVSLKAHYKPHSVNNRFRGLRAFYDWLLDEGEIAVSPFGRPGHRLMKAPAIEEVRKDVVSTADMARMFALLDKQRRWRDAAVLAILYDTGVRASELVDRRTADLDMKTGLLYIEKSKNRRIRTVCLSPKALRYVDRYHRQARPDEEWLINGVRGKMSRSGILQLVKRCFEEIGVAHIGPHDLRHTSASHVAEAGLMGESEAMHLYGWQSPEMWRRYTEQAREKAAIEAHKRASPLERLGKG